MKTYLAKTGEIEREYLLFDASEAPVGRLAVRIANALRGKDKPAGEWRVSAIQPGLDLISRFKPEQVSVCYLNWNGPDHRLNPELWSNEVSLKSGESLTLAHELEWVASQ